MFSRIAIGSYTYVPNVLWRHVTLKGINVFKWNEKLQHNNNVDENKGLVVFRRSPDHLICGILRFDLGSMVQHPSDPDGYFVPQSESLTFLRSLTNVWFFEPDVAHDLARELNSFIRACFRFNALTINCPSSPRLVFVVDLSYTEYRLVDVPRARGLLCKPPRSLPHGFRVTADENEYSDEDEDLYDDDDDDDDEMEGDVEDSYSEEMKDIVWELRNHYKVERTYPLEPLSEEEPLGLVEVGKKLEIVVIEEDAVPSSPCAICLRCLEAKKVAVKTECGHFFHNKCSLSWFGSHFTCPMCRSNTRSIV